VKSGSLGGVPVRSKGGAGAGHQQSLVGILRGHVEVEYGIRSSQKGGVCPVLEVRHGCVVHQLLPEQRLVLKLSVDFEAVLIDHR